LPELLNRPSKICNIRFTLNLIRALEIQQEVVAAGFLLAKRAVKAGLRVPKKYLNRFSFSYIGS
jgi:hypothetical protein